MKNLKHKRIYFLRKKNAKKEPTQTTSNADLADNDFISKFIDLRDEGVFLLDSDKSKDFDVFLNLQYNSIINFHRINDVRYINKYFEKVNSLLPSNGIYIGTFESSVQRKIRILNKYPVLIAYPFYFFTFILKRVFPKWSPTKKLYFFLTQGKNRYLSLAEVLGRLVSCGFEIIDYVEQHNKTYFVVKKKCEPTFDLKPSYGIIFGMKRVGKEGKIIRVYKIRTMHPYAEYLQDFINKKNKLNPGGKFNDDFRITTWGKIFRKLWIDEIPMIINLIKGEIKLVGVRPLSEHYLALYKKEVIELRLKTKPGLLPPYYADIPKNFAEILESEMRYLKSYIEHPLKTDIKYLFLILNNIILRGARSS